MPAADDPLAHTAHRPWPLPRGPWVGAMRWHDLLFAHWAVPADVVRPLIPRALELDTFDRRAWIGVVPFYMTGVRPRLLPPAPGLTRLPELNVRTYVRRRGSAEPRPGVYFFSLDIVSRLATWTARALYKLPYFHADMTCRAGDDGWIDFTSRRRHVAPRARPATAPRSAVSKRPGKDRLSLVGATWMDSILVVMGVVLLDGPTSNPRAGAKPS